MSIVFFWMILSSFRDFSHALYHYIILMFFFVFLTGEDSDSSTELVKLVNEASAPALYKLRSFSENQGTLVITSCNRKAINLFDQHF